MYIHAELCPSLSEDIFSVLIFHWSELKHVTHLLAACDHAHGFYYCENQPIREICENLHLAKISRYMVRMYMYICMYMYMYYKSLMKVLLLLHVHV